MMSYKELYKENVRNYISLSKKHRDCLIMRKCYVELALVNRKYARMC